VSRRLRVTLAVAPVLLVALAVTSLSLGAVTPSPSRGRTRIKLVTQPFLSSAPILIAADLGLFAAEGLDVEFVEIRHSTASLPALAQGQIDVAGAMVSPALFNLIARAAPFRIVAGRSVEARDGCAGNGVIVRKEILAQGRLPNAAALRGLRLSYDHTGAPAFFVGSLLASAGLSLQDVRVSDLAPEVRGEALARDLVDVCMMFEPGLTQALDRGGATLWLRGSDIAPDFQFSYLVMGERLLREDRDAGRRFVRAYLRGVERYLDEGKSPRLIDILARRTRLDPDVLERACWPPTVRDGHIAATSLERYQTWALGAGLIDEKQDVSRLIDDGLLPAAGEKR
jgi:NitT/TauT family transport system substrate-binding protein